MLRSCIILVIDRNDLFLSATALRLHYTGSNFTVPTPPLQPFLVLGQVGVTPTVWDLDTVSEASSLPSSTVVNLNNAVEDQRFDNFQDEGDAGNQ